MTNVERESLSASGWKSVAILLACVAGFLLLLSPDFGGAQGSQQEEDGDNIFRDLDGKDYFAAGCLAEYTDHMCQTPVVNRTPDTCTGNILIGTGSSVVELWAKSSVVDPLGAGICGPSYGEEIVGCEAACLSLQRGGGVCKEVTIDCYGQQITSGYCKCDQ